MKSCLPLVPFLLKWRLIGLSQWFHQLFCNCPMLRQSKSAVHQPQSYSTTLAAPQREFWPQFCLWKNQKITRTKVYRQSVSLPIFRHLHYKPTCVGIYRKKYVFFNDKSEEPLKNPKPTVTITWAIYVTLTSNHTCQQKLYPSGDPVPLKLKNFIPLFILHQVSHFLINCSLNI